MNLASRPKKISKQSAQRALSVSAGLQTHRVSIRPALKPIHVCGADTLIHSSAAAKSWCRLARVVRRSLGKVLVLALFPVMVSAQSITPPAQTTINAPIPTLGSNEPVELTTHEKISLATGGVSFFLPVVSLPQFAGQPLTVGFILDGANYAMRETHNAYAWLPDFMNEIYPTMTMIQNQPTLNTMLWGMPVHPNVPTLTADDSYAGNDTHERCGYTQVCYLGPPPNWVSPPEYCMQNWIFTDWDGSRHSFNGVRDCSYGGAQYVGGPNGYVFFNTSGDGTALENQVSSSVDDAFYVLDATNAADIKIIKRDGTVYHFGGYNPVASQPECHTCDGYGVNDLTFLNRYSAYMNSMVYKDGETVTYQNSILQDSLGRKINLNAGTPGQVNYGIQYEAMNGSSAATVTATALQQPNGTAAWPVQYPTTTLPGYSGACHTNYVIPNGSGITAPEFIYTGPENSTNNPVYSYLISLPNGSHYTLYFDVTGNLTKIVYPSGGYTKYEYLYGRILQSQNFSDVTCVVPTDELLAKHECFASNGSCTPAATVTTINSCAAGWPAGGEATTCYSGAIGLQPASPCCDGGTVVTVVDPEGNKSVHATVGNQAYSVSAPNTPSLSFYRGFMNYEEDYYSGQSALMKSAVYSYTGSGSSTCLSGSVWNVSPCSVTTTSYYGNTQLSSSKLIQYDSVMPFDVTQIQETDYSGNVLKTTNAAWNHTGAYAPWTAGQSGIGNILDVMQSMTETDGVSNQTLTKTFTYDSIGDLEKIAIAGSDITSRSLVYTPLDSYGRPTQFQDGNGNLTKYSFSDAWDEGTCAPSSNASAYLTSVTNAANEVTSFKYDSCTGALSSVKDPNSQTTTYSYDEMNRLAGVSYPDGGSAINQYVDTPPLSVTTTVAMNASTSVVKSVTLDGFARPIQKQLVSDPDGASIVDTQYDALGRVASVTNPYRANISSSTDGTTYYNYDALGRKILQTQPDGSGISTCYGNVQDPTVLQPNCQGNLTTITGEWSDTRDEAGNDTQHISDSLGRLAGVVEPSGYETDYGYNGFSNLLTVNQWSGSSGNGSEIQRTFRYDALSQLIASSNPETGIICYGTVAGGSAQSLTNCTQGYDLNGNLVTKTDARGVVTTFGHDTVYRLISKTFTNAPAGSLASCYQYGVSGTSTAYGIGRLINSWTQIGACPGTLPGTGAQTSKTILAYDAMGRIKKEQQCTPGNCSTTGSPYTLHYDYDLAGNLIHAGDGIGQAAWSPSYDSGGRLLGVSAFTLGPTQFYPSQLFSAVPTPNCPQPYTAAGALAGWTSGSNSGVPALAGCRTYDQRERPTSEMVTGHD